MDKILGKFDGIIYSAFRAVAGFLFMQHGIQKIFGGLGGTMAQSYASMMGLAGFIELIAGILIMVGLFTSIAAFLSSGLMAAAYFLAHVPKGFWPVLNGGELAALFCFAFLYMAARGDGTISLGRTIRRG
ncbi:DoxX family protein [Leptonema illini]|jgi:putative oxidoreductase|uniref:DoxX family protein n=1 Tax=Leptonema illini DSM 21528 TaxID=929563 RepID=H2CD86_9LEPT|nr:DoxX family protein [Leptonema illini]EHQ05390.1 DoxX family protein [Leptonema illini DSM 21528]